MIKLCFQVVLFVTVLWTFPNSKTNAQLDIPLNNSTLSRDPNLFAHPKRFPINGHSDSSQPSPDGPLSRGSREQVNEIGVGDTLNFDRDRSQRYGPPYSDENDRRYYTTENIRPRYNNRNPDEEQYSERYGERYDDDDKYHVRPRPSPDNYYISEKERNNRNGYRDYYSVRRHTNNSLK